MNSQLRKRLAVIRIVALGIVFLAANTPLHSVAERLYPIGTLPIEAAETLNEPTNVIDREHAAARKALGGLDPVPKPAEGTASTNGVPRNLIELFNKPRTPDAPAEKDKTFELQRKLETARYLRTSRLTAQAEPILIELLADESPEQIRQSALLELAAAAQDDNNLPRAQQIYSQFLSKWANDLRVPEILLRQGLIFRQMGLNNLALTKFYAVMTSALVLKNDHLEYYAKLVQQAQSEIAETHYALGKYTDAAEFFTRLLKQTNITDRSSILYKLTRCQSATGQHAEAIANANDFLIRFPNAPEQPEIRFLLADSLKQLRRDNESLQQVLLLLKEQKELTKDRPAVWAYWQQRAGNLIGNHLYREGDYAKALEVYLSLVQLDDSPAWKLPVTYQIGMTYERLWQPLKAAETYAEILNREKELADTASPGLKSIFDMARWRMNLIDWQNKAEEANRRFNTTPETNTSVTASLPLNSPSIP
jgi:hypothetical protein